MKARVDELGLLQLKKGRANTHSIDPYDEYADAGDVAVFAAVAVRSAAAVTASNPAETAPIAGPSAAADIARP